MPEPDRPRVMIDGQPPDYLRQLLTPHVELIGWQQRPGPDAADVQGVLTYEHPRVDEPLLQGLPRCRVISNHGVGVDHIDIDAAARHKIPVGNTPDVLNGAVADLAFALLLAAARRLPESIRLAAAHDTTYFDQSQLHGQEVHGSTLGILGMGRVGEQIARRARGFDMTVIYHNRRRRPDAEARLQATYVSMDELLSCADYVMVVVPLNKETRGLMRSEQLRGMKSEATLINVARGAVVDTADLVQALREGTIRAAALDVTDPEPLPRDHPLLQMDNVIITSHIGSATAQTRRKMADLSVQNLLCGLRGENLVCQVS